MTTKVYIALDLFFHHWNSDDKAAWLGVQPYMQGTPEQVANWLKLDASSGANTEFILLDPMHAAMLDTEKLVPLPLPCDLSLSVKLYNSADQLIDTISIERKNHCKLENPARLRELNQFANNDDVVSSAEAYPKLFVDTLKNSLSDAEKSMTAMQIVDALKQKLELGQRQKYDASCFSLIGDAFDARRDEDDSGIQVTNTHYLLGQLVKLGTDVNQLKQVSYFELYLDEKMLINSDDSATTAKIFSSITPTFEPTSFEQKMLWSDSFSRRINALPQGDSLKVQQISLLPNEEQPEPVSPYLWRLGRKSQAHTHQENAQAQVSDVIRWAQLERLDIREKTEVEKPLLIDNQFAQIELTPVVTFDVKLARYRKTPQVNDTQVLTSMLTSVQPVASEAQRFMTMLHQFAELFESAEIYVVNATGKIKGEKDKTRQFTYKLTPDSMRAMSFPWQPESELLAFFNTDKMLATSHFPDDVEYDFSEFIYQDAVLVIKLRENITLQRLGVDPDEPSFIARDSIFGPRWEYWHQSKAGTMIPDFDGLICQQLDGQNIDMDQLIVSAFHHDKKDYELAQSARRLEGIAKVEFNGIVETDPDDPDSYSFEQTVIEDKTNHNQLNLVESRVDFQRVEKEEAITRRHRKEHRNDSSAIGAFKSVLIETDNPLVHDIHHAYRVVMTDKTSAPHQELVAESADQEQLEQQLMGQLNRKHPSPRDFYTDVYENIGDTRNLQLDLEHTYGSSILPTEVKSIPNPIDEPILLGSEVAYVSDGTRIQLWQVSLGVNSEGHEVVKLHLDKRLLDPEWAKPTSDAEGKASADNSARQLAHIQAWQSVAEMYYGESVKLVAECYSFNIHQVTIEEKDNAVQSGLENESIELTQARAKIQQLIEMVFIDQENAPDSLEIITGHNWQQDCHAVRFRLDVIRKDSMLPELTADYWEVHQRKLTIPEQGLEDLFTLNGPATEQLKSAEISRQIKQYLNALKRRGGYLQPKNFDTQASRNEQFFALLGNGESPAHVIPSNNAWLIPTKLKKEQGNMQAAYCPVGITPVVDDPHLKNKTSPLIRRYFDALQSLIEFEAVGWYRQDAAKLAKQIEQLHRLVNSGGYRHIIEKAKSKFKPVPDFKAEPEKLVASIRTLSRDSQTLGNSLQSTLDERINKMLTNQPMLFSSLKSLALIELKGESERQLRKDYFDLYMCRKIKESEPAVDKLIGPEKLLTKNAEQLIYLEQLDDGLFDNGFAFEQFNGETAERLFEQEPAGTTKPELQVSLVNGKIDIPVGQPVPVSEASIRLPSRRGVNKPVPGATKLTSIGEHPGNQYLSLPALLKAEIKPVVEADDEKENHNNVVYQDRLAASYQNKSDTIIVSAIFQVNGDEESDQISHQTKPEIVTDKFDNDAFYVLVSDKALVSAKQEPEKMDSEFERLVNQLESKTPLSLQSDLMETVLHTKNVDKIAGILAEKSTEHTMPALNLRQKAFRIVTDKFPGKLGLEDLSQEISGDRNRAQALQAVYPSSIWLFKNDNHDTFVWVEVELPVWQSKYISLVQTRNQAGLGDPQQEIYAPEFATISQPVGDAFERVSQYHRYRNETQHQLLQNKKMSVIEFSQKVLAGKIDSIDMKFAGAANILYITIKEDSSGVFPSNLGQHTVFNGSVATFSREIFPLDSQPLESDREYWNEEEKYWFPENAGAGRWRIDFEWRNPSTNDEVLRLEDIPVFLEG